MEKRLKRWISTIIAILTFMIGFAACSDEVVDSEAWRKQLISHDGIMTFSEPSLSGDDFSYIGFGIRIVDKDTGRDLLNNNPGNVRESDFYFEIGDFKYHVGDSVGLLSHFPGLKLIEITQPHYDNFYYLSFYYLKVSNKLATRSPIDFTIDFVWPSKNIRKKIRTYVEFNNNFVSDAKNAGPDQYGYVRAWLYKVGYWVDGISATEYDVQEDGSYCDYKRNFPEMMIIPVNNQ